MHTDDEVYNVDAVFLGPPGTRLPWRARYQAYGVGALLTVLMLIALGKTGLMGFWPIVYGMLAVIWLTRKIMPHVTHDHSVKALVRTFFNEVRAPRSKRHQAVVAVMSASGIRRRSCR
ncbi:hypothetical protein [Streptomyces sp. CB03238]|uniref:hypothetical protein n=1 Tax=Streptomyces sp. CB03238 TaxID=1907777 RepID=UPI000A1094F0|nr:hypothetical protein [Streptomyces sp. CB03238]ORT54195.1 hypothetical protein BKD26_35985 [Streptomyces sp. CB03238]